MDRLKEERGRGILVKSVLKPLAKSEQNREFGGFMNVSV